MEDVKTSVCCMCGDIGFSVELFRCNNCLYRFQHSYCSNNYMKSSKVIEICDWCQSEQKSSPCSTASSSKAIASNVDSITITSKPSEYSGDSTSPTKSRGASDQMRKNIISGVPSPRTAARRYKLLKDVKC